MREGYVDMNVGEGKVLNTWLKNRINSNKNALLVTVGATGSGKSYCNLRELELWYKFYFKQDKPPYENIVFNLKDAMKLMRNNELPKGSMIVVEEAGVLMNSLDFQNKISKFFGYVLQSFRSKNLIIIFNLPNMSFLNRTARLLLHLIMVTKDIDKTKKQVIIKALRLQVNPMTSKPYPKYFMIGRTKVKELAFSMPSKELIDVYESNKEKFVNKTMDDAIDEMENDTKQEIDYTSQIKEIFKKYDNPSVKMICSLIKLSKTKLYEKHYDSIITEERAAQMLRKGLLVPNSPIPVPI